MRRAPAAALLGLGAAVLLAGCFDGTVRNPPGAASKPGHQKGDKPKRKSKPQQSGGDGIAIAAVGDTALGITPILPPQPSTYLDPIAPELAGDVVFGNLEGTLTDVSENIKCTKKSEEKGECFAFRAPPEYAGYLADAGFTVMSLANNHSYDFGEAGQAETVEALRGAGIEPTGLLEGPAVVTAGGRKVAFLGFASYDYAPLVTDLETAAALIAEADEAADLVVVANHVGAEGSDALHVSGETEIYLGEDRGNPEAFAHMAIDAGADLVLGSGPHVLRGMEIYKRRLVAYSLGNFSGFHNFATEGVLGLSVVLHVALSPEGAFRSGRLASVQLVEAGQPVPDPSGAGASLVAELSAEDFGEAGIGVDGEGRIIP